LVVGDGEWEMNV
jgi:hypothetical protein